MASEVVESVLALMRANTARLKPPSCGNRLLPCPARPEAVIVKLPDRAPVVSKFARRDYREGTRDKRCRGQKPKYKRRRKKYLALGRVEVGLQ